MESAAEPRNTELEAAILEDPDSRAAWRIYADWLLDQGELRGELIVAMTAFDRGERTDALMRAHPGKLLGPLADPGLASWVACDWMPGFWRSLTVTPPPWAALPLEQALQRLLSHPSASLLQSLSVWMAPKAGDWRGVIEAIVAHAGGRVMRSLSLGSSPRWEGRSSALPGELLEPLLANADLPRLERLVLEGTLSTDALPELLARSPLLPRLKRLSLARGRLTEAGAEVLMSMAAHFRHLEALDIDGNDVTGMLRALKREIPCVRTGKQRGRR